MDELRVHSARRKDRRVSFYKQAVKRKGIENDLLYQEDWTKQVNGREIAVWGTGRDAPEAVCEIEEEGMEAGFFVSRDWKHEQSFLGKEVRGKETLSKESHYVIVGSSLYGAEIEEELKLLGFVRYADYAFYVFSSFISQNDYTYNGVPIGKGSYFPDSWKPMMSNPENGGVPTPGNFVESIGRFTSIHGSAMIHGNHHLNMICTGHVKLLMSREAQAKFPEQPKKNRLRIGNDVWISANVFINVSRVKEIGDGAIIGTGAVVLHDVPPYAVVVGVPGKIKRYRYTPEQIECLLRVRWWDWSMEQIEENAELLIHPQLFFERFK